MAKSVVSAGDMTGKILSIVIAVVIVGVVLVPIINGLTDSESGDQSTTITNSGIGFAKTDRDDAVHTMIISKDTNDKMKVTVDGLDVAIPTIPNDDFTSESEVTLGIGPNHNMIVAYAWGIVTLGDTNLKSWEQGDVTITFQNGIAYSEEDGISSVVCSCEIDLYRSNTVDYVYCTDHAKAPLDATVYVGHWDALEYDGITGGYVCLHPDSGLMNEVVVDTTYCMGTEYGPMPGIEVAEVNTTEYYYEVSEFSTYKFGYDIYDGTDYIPVENVVYHPGVYVPATFTISGGEGGNSDDNNVINTILSIIPIFVILGIIGAFIVPMITNKTN